MELSGTPAKRLFAGSCAAVAALAFSFAALGGAMFQLKSEFNLDNAQIGLVGGAGLWGMALSQVSFSSLCDVVGMRALLRISLLGHLAGIVVFVTAHSFTALFIGALVLAVANGTVEAVCNPLVATLFPDRKAGMLNRLHLWFPGGVALGGLAVWCLDLLHAGWRADMLIVLVPALLYGGLLSTAHFPPTEAAQQGSRLRDTARAVLSTPALWGLMLLMMITMSLELGPNRWIPAVLEAGGLPGILVLVLINGVMALMRSNAHAILRRISPPALLSVSCGVAGLGLLSLSFAQGLGTAVAASLLFAVGVSMIWPTMMGFVSERAPHTGALGLGLMAAAGSLAVGLVATPLLGQIADAHIAQSAPAAQVHALAAHVLSSGALGNVRIVQLAQDNAAADSPPVNADELLRGSAAGDAGPLIAAEAAPILHAAENRSGLLSFRYLVPFAAILCVIFALVLRTDRSAGGYAAQVARVRLKPKLTS